MSVAIDHAEGELLSADWSRWGIDCPLEVVDSPYRSLIQPLVKEVRELSPNPLDAVGVVIPEFLVTRWWHSFLHNQTALLIKASLLFEENVVVVDVPYRLKGNRRRPRAAQVASGIAVPTGEHSA